MLANARLRPGLVQIMSTRTLDPRTAVLLTDQTCDDVTIIPATDPRNNNLVRWLTHDGFVDWACTLVFDACCCPRCCNWEMNMIGNVALVVLVVGVISMYVECPVKQ